MKTRIQQRLKELESEYGFKIIYACESGSRAWGFTSDDSDYDVRFIYVWRAEDYLSVYSPSDQIDLGVDAENLDFSGWDLRKSLSLFRKSNGAVMEWLHSPIVYVENESVVAEWRELVAQFFVPHSTFAHYYRLAKKMHLSLNEAEEVTAKKYLYIMRALLSARHIVDSQSPPPVLFSAMLDASGLNASIVNAVEEMIEEKVSQQEKTAIKRVSILDQFIDEELVALDKAMAEVPKGEQGCVAELDKFFRSVVGETI